MNHRILVCYFVAASLSVSALHPVNGEEEADAYRVRDVWQLTFEGNETFDDMDLRHALALDGPVQVMVHARVPLNMFRAAVLVRLKDGYRSKGFADVSAKTKPGAEDQPLTVILNEGARYVCGEIRVLGDSEVERKQLVEGLRLKTAEEEDGKSTSDLDEKRWITGDTANFSEGVRQQLRNRVARLLHLQGFHFPTFDVAILPEVDSGTAVLQVDIRDAGGRQLVDTIEITGLGRNTEQEIRDLLALPDPLFATGDLEAAVSEKIEATGRFVFAKATTDTPFEADDAVTLHINVLEYEKVAPLGEALDPVHAALIKCARWFRDLPQRRDDLKVTVRAEGRQDAVNGTARRLSGDLLELPPSLVPHEIRGEFLIAGQGGGIQHLMAFDEQSQLIVDISTIGIRQTLGAINRMNRTTWISDTPAPGFVSTIKLDGHEPDENGHRFKMFAGFSVSSDESPVHMRVLANPAALIDFVEREEQTTLQTENGISRITFKTGSLEIETESGALRHAAFKTDDYEVTVEGRRGLLEETLAELQQETESWPNTFDAQKPVRSAVRFATTAIDDLIAPLEIKTHPAWNLARRLLNDEVAMEHLATQLEALQSDHNFSIPVDKTKDTAGTSPGWQFHALKGLVPAGSAAHRLISAVGLQQATGQSAPLATLGTEIVRDDRHGPVTCLLTGLLLPRARPVLAVAGLKRIDATTLPPELVALLDEPCLLGQFLRTSIEIVRGLDDEDVQALIPILDQAAVNSRGPDEPLPGFIVRVPIQMIRNHPSDDPNEIAKGLLSLAWSTFLHEKVRTLLESWQHSSPSQPSKIRPASESTILDQPTSNTSQQPDDVPAPVDLPQ